VVEGVLSAFVDAAIALLSFVAQIALAVLLASIRPWRYVLSPRFRASFNAQYDQRSIAAKWFALVWGSITLIASVAIVLGIVWLVLNSQQRTHDTHHRVSAAREAVSTLIRRFKHDPKDK
jgi:hypothetical protein